MESRGQPGVPYREPNGELNVLSLMPDSPYQTFRPRPAPKGSVANLRSVATLQLLRFPAVILFLVALNAVAFAQPYEAALMKRVNKALRADNRLNGASAYTAARGVIVLYGTVFDENDRELAERTARQVRGVHQVDNTLRTKTGQWREEEARINDTLRLNDLPGVSVTVIGSQAYLSGQVSTQGEKDRAVRVVSSQSNLNIVNLVRIVPGSLFSSADFY
jgi:BON domain